MTRLSRVDYMEGKTKMIYTDDEVELITRVAKTGKMDKTGCQGWDCHSAEGEIKKCPVGTRRNHDFGYFATDKESCQQTAQRMLDETGAPKQETKPAMAHEFKVGDRAFDILRGEVFTIKTSSNGVPTFYPFRIGLTEITEDGREDIAHKYPRWITLEEAEKRGLYKKPKRVDCDVEWFPGAETGAVYPARLGPDNGNWRELVGKRGKLIFIEEGAEE